MRAMTSLVGEHVKAAFTLEIMVMVYRTPKW